MLEKWCHELQDNSAVERLGSPNEAVPEPVYGLLSALLFRSQELGDDVSAELRYLGYPLPEGPFQLVLFALEDPQISALSGRDRHNCRLNLYSAMRTHIQAMPGTLPEGFLFLMCGYLLGILFPGPDTVSGEAIGRDAVRYAREDLGVQARVTVGPLWTGTDQMSRAFRTVQDLEDSRSFYGDMIAPVFVISPDSLLRIVDQTQRTKFEQTFFQTAARICGTVQAGSVDAAAACLRDQLRAIAENCVGLPYPNALNMTCNRFISLLQYRLSEENLADWRYLSEQDFSRELISCSTLEEYLDVSERMAALLVAHTKSRSAVRHDRLMHEIRSFVMENATDMNMGLTAVAREFNIKPREAAESFRSYFGQSINDAIHQARVRRAKELLLTTDDSVQQIAEAVGYCSLATMYRAFTNLEGVAPGQFRKGGGD